MSEQLLEALVTIRLEVGVALERPLLKLLSAISAHEALGVEFVGHGGDDAAVDPLPADGTLVFGFRIFGELHFFNERPAEHFRHVLLLERLPKFAQTSGQVRGRVAQLHVLGGHSVVAVEAVHQVVQLLARLVRLNHDAAVIPEKEVIRHLKVKLRVINGIVTVDPA